MDAQKIATKMQEVAKEAKQLVDQANACAQNAKNNKECSVEVKQVIDQAKVCAKKAQECAE